MPGLLSFLDLVGCRGETPGGGGGGHLGIFWVGMCRARLQIGTPF